MDKYYQIFEKNKGTKHGLILKSNLLKELECVAGENWDDNKKELLPHLKIKYNGSKIENISEEYSFQEISSKEARFLIDDWNFFLECIMEGGYNPTTPWRNM